MTDALSTSAVDRGGDAAAAVEAFLARVERTEPTLRAFRQIDGDRLRAEAAALDAVPAHRRGPLHGMLIAVKEVFDVAGYECGWGTPIHDGRRPSSDAWAVGCLRDAGALIAGITVSTEYAMSRVGPTSNPFDAARSPGASSQGSAAAVGAGLAPAALGTQTIGSIIRPAAYCGCIGAKPSWGAIPAAGAMVLSEWLDHVGFMAADPDVAAAILDALMPSAEGDEEVPAARCGVLRPWYAEGMTPDVSEALAVAGRKLTEAGVDVRDDALPQAIVDNEAQALDRLLSHDMALHHGGDYDRHAEMMSDRVRDYIERGRKVTAAEYDAALGQRAEMADALDDWIGDRVLVMPATVGVAPLLVEGTGPREPQRLWSLTGQPAMTVPVAQAQGLPVGVQVVARRGGDRRVLAVVRHLYEATQARP